MNLSMMIWAQPYDGQRVRVIWMVGLGVFSTHETRKLLDVSRGHGTVEVLSALFPIWVFFPRPLHCGVVNLLAFRRRVILLNSGLHLLRILLVSVGSVFPSARIASRTKSAAKNSEFGVLLGLAAAQTGLHYSSAEGAVSALSEAVRSTSAAPALIISYRP